MELTNFEFTDDGNGNLISDNTGELMAASYVIQITVAGVTKTVFILSDNN